MQCKKQLLQVATIQSCQKCFVHSTDLAAEREEDGLLGGQLEQGNSDVKLKIEFSQRIDLKKTENFKPHKQGHQHFGHLSIILATFKRLF